MEPVYKYIEGWLGLGALVWIIAIVALCYAIWKIAQRYALYKNKADNLPCDKHEQMIQSMASSINGINVTLARLEGHMEGMRNMISMMAGSTGTSQLTQNHSPISLTPKGQEIAEQLKLDDILSANWSKVESIIDDEKNPYDIQMEFITRFISSPDEYIDGASMDKIKRDAYMRGLPLIDYMRMLGIMARDRYFQQHGIDVSEVDKWNAGAFGEE